MSPAERDDRQLPEFTEIDRLVHEPARLMLMAALYVVESADFLFLMHQTNLTQGNLSSHMNKLEAAGYIDVEKGFRGKRPHTTLRLTAAGRAAFDTYRQRMEEVLGSVPTDRPNDGKGLP
jgi:DNA-binding MarR family transcriptional regulator